MISSVYHDAFEHQQQLFKYLKNFCQHHGGWISFADFMHIALYAPGLGYYSAGMTKFGKEGDFVTAPEISPLFSQSIANFCIPILKTLKNSSILELGAGSGKMAATLLQHLTQKDCLPEKYTILEVSADLKERQQQYLKTHCPNFYSRIEWLSALPHTFNGILLANEVLDAMPVHLFQISDNQTILEGGVYCDDTWRLSFKETQNSALINAVTALSIPLQAGYTSEINLQLAPWLASLSDCLNQGVMLFIDYGFPRHEYYHRSRHMGTLMCHYQHHAHPDPLQHIGLQDITAHVDFTALALAATQCGLDVAGYTHQAGFLLGNGILDLAQSNDPKQQWAHSAQIQQLTHPHEMGELFKAMALTKNIEMPLTGFDMFDLRHKL